MACVTGEGLVNVCLAVEIPSPKARDSGFQQKTSRSVLVRGTRWCLPGILLEPPEVWHSLGRCCSLWYYCLRRHLLLMTLITCFWCGILLLKEKHFQIWIMPPAFSELLLGYLSAISLAREGKKWSPYSRYCQNLHFTTAEWDPLVFFSPLTKTAHPFGFISVTLATRW